MNINKNEIMASFSGRASMKYLLLSKIWDASIDNTLYSRWFYTMWWWFTLL